MHFGDLISPKLWRLKKFKEKLVLVVDRGHCRPWHNKEKKKSLRNVGTMPSAFICLVGGS